VARPDEVLAATGFEPGGVAPFPAPGISQVLIAGELLAHDRVWIGAGSERHMAGISPVDLARIARARTAELS
jgi:prolyl-tRNA editing enzyme YbaK/EbsC (Cys-tRNA(Pro) deacylase)